VPAEPVGELRCEARLENLERIRNFVEDGCRRAGGDDPSCFALKLAVDEACTNIIQHGYRGRGAGDVRLTFANDAEKMTVTIQDHAPPFAPDNIPLPDRAPGWERRAASGLGWHFIQSTMDSVEYRPDARRGNRLTLVKRKRSSG
jgi:anti-sigma regulatory factor (Ser/Thr protein kinase)